MNYSIITFGCRVNQADSLAIEEKLRARGATASSSADADVVIVNTCSVTASSDQSARQTIRRIARDNPSARVVVTGCYASRRPDDVGALPGVVRLIPNSDKDRLVDLVASEIGLTTAERFANGDGPCGLDIEPGVAGRTAFTLRVQTGCEERCSYCIIPTTRGSGKSLPLAEVVDRVSRVAAAGYKEIAIAGVHLGSYGRDLGSPTSLLALLQSLDVLPADVTFRVSSLEPMDCTREIVDLIARSGRFAPHFHLPLQHGSDAVLARMQRPYTVRFYRELIEYLLTRIPHASIGSDLIAGFPGESDAEFRATTEYLSSSGLSHLHVFPYSDRPGTLATTMPAKIPGAVVRERAMALRAIGSELSRRFRRAQIGSIRPALTLDDGTVVVTDNYLKLKLAPGLSRNVRVRVRVEDELSATVLSIPLPRPSRSAPPVADLEPGAARTR